MGYQSIKVKIEGSLKILFKSKKATILAKRRSKDLLILGNGPSIKKDISQLLELAKTRDVLGVNYFPATNEFITLKPRYQMIASSQYWNIDENESWDNDRKKLFEILVEKVTWELHLFVPIIARNSNAWKVFMAQNDHIKISYFNLTSIDGHPLFFKNSLKNFKACPRPHNVLIPSILMGINLGYDNCYLAGADHSWLPEIFVTQDNIVMAAQKHFYQEQFKSLNSTLLSDDAKPFFHPNSLKTQKLHEILLKFYYSFKSYWILKEYAESQGTKIYNLTEGSFIDAFDKLTYDEITA